MPDIFISGQDAIEDTPPQEFSLSEKMPLETKDKSISNAEKHARIRDERHNLPGHTHNLLSSYFFYPEKIDFVNRDPEEVVVLMVRRHAITNLPWLLLSFVLIIAPAFLSVLPVFEQIPSQMQLILAIVWYMITAAYMLESFLSWFFNVNIVTDERIIDVDFVNLIYREITDADIEQIQDVTVEVGGTIRTIFGFGDVLIQTASEMPKTKFEAVPNPDQVALILRKLRVEEQEEELKGLVR